MGWEIPFVFILLILALASFIWEKLPPDLTAIALFAILIASGVLPLKDALGVFSNPAPLTVGAMFILSAALNRAGIIDRMVSRIGTMDKVSYGPFLLVVMLVTSFLSAFVNNTPVVVIMMPVVLTLAKKFKIAGSKVLIPLSYAAIMGGTCTLIGTSTNILVDSIAQNAGEQPMGMFEFAYLGLPIVFVGTFAVMLLGKRLLPVRETLTSILSEDERREYLTEAFVSSNSPTIGKTLKESGLTKLPGIRVIDVVRSGVSLQSKLAALVLEPGDRLMLECRASNLTSAQGLKGLDFVSESNLGIEQIAAHEGLIVEGIINSRSQLLGKTIDEVDFRLHYRMAVLAVHRKGKNMREHIGTMRLQFGDTLLMVGTKEAIQNLRRTDDIALIEGSSTQSKVSIKSSIIVLGSIVGIVLGSAMGWFRIEAGAIVVCAIIFLTNCLKPKEGYASIEWNLLFLIYGMLGMGVAMDRSGASQWMADNMIAGVGRFVAPEHQAFAMLACIYLATTLLTEVLSNNAAAVLMATLAIGIAETLGVSLRPFLFAIAIAASASFATPIGYQTNTYVYGAGGYRFSDFARIGVVMNLLCMILALLIVPMVWPF